MIGSIHGGGRGYGSGDYDKGIGKAFDYLFVMGNMDVDVHMAWFLTKVIG